MARTREEVNYVNDCHGCERPCSLCNYLVGDFCGVLAGAVNPEGHCDMFEQRTSLGSLSSMSMMITKASFDKDTKEMRFSATASDTSIDSYQSRMTMTLFKDFIKRIEDGEQVPVVLRSEFWSGGNPYVSLGHYLDLDGFAILGMVTNVYIDGNRLKMKGIFKNDQEPELAKRAYEAIKADIKNDVPMEQRVRVSIAFLDWQHRHTANQFVFVRNTLSDKCTVCQGVRMPGDIVEHEKGHLVQCGLTRVPANKGTDVVLEERAMPQTALEDAASIVGEDLAQRVHEESKKRGLVQRTSEQEEAAAALVVKSESEEVESPPEPVETPEPPAPEPEPAQVPDVQERSEEPTPQYTYLPLEGAITIADAKNVVAAREEVARLMEWWHLLQDVIWNIFDREDVVDKKAAIADVIKEFKGGLEVRALVALSMVADMAEQHASQQVDTVNSNQEQIMPDNPHALDPFFTEFRNTFDSVIADTTLTREQMLQKLQDPANKLGGFIQRSVAQAVPPTPQDINTQVAEAVKSALEQYIPGLAQIAGAQAGQQRTAATAANTPNAQDTTPAPRQAVPGFQMLGNAQQTQQPVVPVVVPGGTQQLMQGRQQPDNSQGDFISGLVKRSVVGPQRAEKLGGNL